jgi:hypothetical protein
MYTNQQPGAIMSYEYDRDAYSELEGNGILKPRNWDPDDTSLLARAPGYSIFLAVIYSVTERSYFYVQLFQNIINSIPPVLIFLISGLLITWRVGLVAGLLSAISHHLSYYSNLVLPDSLAGLPVLLGFYVLVRARRPGRGSLAAYGVAGSLFGVAAWLRPNLLLMGPLIAIVLTLASTRPKREIRRGWLVAVLPFVVVAPITIRNYVVFHRLVPISENMGIVLWEGIGDAGGAEFGAPTTDGDVALQESVFYGDATYAHSWATPDGITRDRDRIKRSLGVIMRHPLWFARAMAVRMNRMVSYVAEADLVQRHAPDGPAQEAALGPTYKPEKAARRMENSLRQAAASSRALAVGEALGPTRPGARWLQRVAKETGEPFIFLGLVGLLILAPRRVLILLGVPIYYLLIQSTMHFEFRYTLPMHYFLFVFAATVWVLAARGAWRLLRTSTSWCLRRLRIGLKEDRREWKGNY